MVKKDTQNIKSVKKKKQRKNNNSSSVGKLKKKFCLHHTSLFPKEKENSI